MSGAPHLESTAGKLQSPPALYRLSRNPSLLHNFHGQKVSQTQTVTPGMIIVILSTLNPARESQASRLGCFGAASSLGLHGALREVWCHCEFVTMDVFGADQTPTQGFYSSMLYIYMQERQSRWLIVGESAWLNLQPVNLCSFDTQVRQDRATIETKLKGRATVGKRVETQVRTRR